MTDYDRGMTNVPSNIFLCARNWRLFDLAAKTCEPNFETVARHFSNELPPRPRTLEGTLIMTTKITAIVSMLL